MTACAAGGGAANALRGQHVPGYDMAPRRQHGALSGCQRSRQVNERSVSVADPGADWALPPAVLSCVVWAGPTRLWLATRRLIGFDTRELRVVLGEASVTARLLRDCS